MGRKNRFIDAMRSRGYKYIGSDVFNISNRVTKYDSNLVLFYNPYKERYEIHTSLYFDKGLPSYCVSAKDLDAELLLKLKRADNRTEYGYREKMDEIESSYKKEDREREQNYNDLKEDILKRIGKKFI